MCKCVLCKVLNFHLEINYIILKNVESEEFLQRLCLNLALHYYASGSYAKLTESQRSVSATASPLLSA